MEAKVVSSKLRREKVGQTVVRQVEGCDVNTVLKGRRFYKLQSIVRDINHSLIDILKGVLLDFGYIILRQI